MTLDELGDLTSYLASIRDLRDGVMVRSGHFYATSLLHQQKELMAYYMMRTGCHDDGLRPKLLPLINLHSNMCF